MSKVSRPNSTLKSDTEKQLRRREPLERRHELKPGVSGDGPRRPQLKRSGPTRVAGYSYEGFCLAIADRMGADCWVRRNVPLEPALLACDGKLDGHHILKKAWLKGEFSDGLHSADSARTSDAWDLPQSEAGIYHLPLAAILNDPRNGLLACRKHHDLIENARVTLTADLLPRCVFEFAAELGDRAVARLERNFGPAKRGTE